MASAAVLVTGVLMSACGAQPTAELAPVANPEGGRAQTTAAPPAGTVTIFAAASLGPALRNIAADFEAAHPAVRVETAVAGSQALATQLVEGARADVFASADARQMERLVAAGLVAEGAARPLAASELVVVTPVDDPADIASLADLAAPGVKVVLAAEAVPAGAYARELLAGASHRDAFGRDFAAAVLGNVVSHESHVTGVLTKVASGEADAGIVYEAGARRDNVRVVPVPRGLGIRATYLVAAVRNGTAGASRAAALIDHLLSPGGQAALRRHGFDGAADLRFPVPQVDVLPEVEEKGR